MQNLIFLHIPKTAGATFRGILQRKYEPEKAFFIENHNVIPSIEKLYSLPQQEKDALSFIMGHVDFGVHTHFNQAFSYLTVFRNPIDRIISHYNYVKSQPTHYLYNWVRQENIDLKTYVASGKTSELNNGMVRMMTGQGGYHRNQQGTVAYGACPDELLDQALDHLNTRFLTYGIQEYFDESLLLMSKKIGWGSMHYLSQNVRKKTKERPPLSQEEEDVLAEYNGLDIQLYRYAKEAFEKELKKYASYLEGQKKILSIQNKAYTIYASSKGKLKQILVKNAVQ